MIKKRTIFTNLTNLAILVVLMAVYAVTDAFIFILVLFGAYEVIGINSIAVAVAIVVFCAIPLLLGVIFVRHIPSWLLSLPIQFLVCFIAMFGFSTMPFESFYDSLIVSFLLLLLQAAGVGIKMLYRSIKAKRLQKSNTSE